MNNITEDKIRTIVRQELEKLLVEGIDITGKRTISVNNNHQNYVGTNNSHEPYLFGDTQRGYKTLSIFQCYE